MVPIVVMIPFVHVVADSASPHLDAIFMKSPLSFAAAHHHFIIWALWMPARRPAAGDGEAAPSCFFDR